jgi:hypothetical protein
MFNQEQFYKAVKAIRHERKFQDEMWGDSFDDAGWSPAEWLIFIETYVNKAKGALLGCEDMADGHHKQMDNIRKIAALCVAAMENRGVVKR